jgi:hypothetical protein
MSALTSKRIQNLANAALVVGRSATSPLSDGLHITPSLIQVLVYDDVIVIQIVLHLQAGSIEPGPNFVFGILPARSDPLFKFLP